MSQQRRNLKNPDKKLASESLEKLHADPVKFDEGETCLDHQVRLIKRGLEDAERNAGEAHEHAADADDHEETRLEAIKHKASDMLDGAKHVGEAIVEKLHDKASSALEHLKDAGAAIGQKVEAIKESAGQKVEAIKESASEAIDGLKEKVSRKSHDDHSKNDH